MQAEIQRDLDIYRGKITGGNVADWGDYMKHVGIVMGLHRAKDTLAIALEEYRKRLDPDDEDDGLVEMEEDKD